MSVYPHSRVFVGPGKTIDIAGPHVQVLDNETGSVVNSTSDEHHEQKEAAIKSGPIRCAAVDSGFKYLLTSGEDKILRVWEIEGLKLLNERELPKKPTSVAFTADSQTLLVSDKFGDVFSYPFTYVPLTVKQKKDALSSHENPSGGQLILGHASPLNAFLLTPDEKYIITADRDEHIRVSWYPKGYNIEMYCLGHHKFVSAIHIPKTDGSSLISGGGDPVLKIWDWMKGTVKHELPILEAVEPFIVIRAVKRRRGWSEEDGEETTEGKRKGGRGKVKKKQQEAVDVADEEQGKGEEEVVGTPTASTENGEEAKPEKVLVIHRIESVESNTGAYIVFSAVGTTALFTFPYKTDVSKSEIKYFDFGRPVIDFSLVDNKTILVNLDGGWRSSEESADGEPSTSSEPSMVRFVRMTDGQFVEDSEELKALVSSLNSSALLSATTEEIKRLDLYGDLTSMPKYHSDGDGAAIELGEGLPIGAPQLSASETVKKVKGKGKAELTKKELGRMKGKQAVLEKAQEVVRKGTEEDGEGEGSEEPKTKKAKSEGCGTEIGDADVMMTGA